MNLSAKFQEILVKCAGKTGNWGVFERENHTVLYFEVTGFSKSGHAKLYEVNNKIFCATRYDNVTEIENYDDLARIAWNWYDEYRYSGYNLPEEWKKDFIRLGYIEIRTKTVEEVIIK